MKQRLIYFMKPVGMPGPIKIGCSCAPERRLREFSGWCPFPLEIIHAMPGDLALELRLHSAFADLHSHGEWFHAGDRLSTAVDRLIRGAPLEEAIDLNDVRGKINTAAHKKRWTTERRRKASFTHRVRGACERAGTYRAPAYIEHILDEWRPAPKHVYAALGKRVWAEASLPTDDEIATLEAFIANPLARAAA